MRSQLRRLILAACLSLLFAGGTLLWYHLTASELTKNGETPLAQAAQVGNEVLRRPAARLLWQSINTGDNLYSGETIRTSSLGELRIQFENGRYVDVQPDSLIVLEKSKGEVSLDLVDGSLFVNGTSKSDDGLVLNSAGGKIDLARASASVSKGASGRIDMHVSEGQAKIRSANGKEKEIKSGSNSAIDGKGLELELPPLFILSPSPTEPYYVDPEAGSIVSFKWKGFLPTWRVSLLVGSSRKNLREKSTTDRDGQAELGTKLPFGKHWWKLVAKDSSGKVMQESSFTQLEVRGRYPPAIVTPDVNAQLRSETLPMDVDFAWQRPAGAIQIRLEVSNQVDFKKLLFDKSFETEQAAIVPGLQAGAYHARLSVTYPEFKRPLVSKVHHFSISSSKKELVQISWTVPPEKRTQIFIVKPELEFSWAPKNRMEDIASYRVLLENEEKPDMAPVQLTLEQLTAKTPLPTGGRYIANVEALDKNGNSIGKSEPLSLTATEAPLIDAPLLQPSEGELKSRADGRTDLNWTTISGAKEYGITLINKDGKSVFEKKYVAPTAKLQNLMPGEYSVTVNSFDVYGRKGKESVSRKLIVPQTSDIQSPKLKKVKIE